MASYWGMDMRGMFHRNDTETLVDEEVSQFLIKDLPWEDNLLIRQADSFIPSSSRKRMIDWWAGKQGILEHQGIGKYEWTAKSKASQPLQCTTWVELPKTKANETYEAHVTKFFNQVSEKVVV